MHFMNREFNKKMLMCGTLKYHSSASKLGVKWDRIKPGLLDNCDPLPFEVIMLIKANPHGKHN